MIQLMGGGVLGNTWSRPLMQVNDKPAEKEMLETTGVDKTAVVS